MALRCLLFSSDEGAAEPIRQVLAELGIEGEDCSEAVRAAEKITNESFQIVLIDWEKQPEAGLLLTAARERKAAERPLTLAIVSDDASVPQALQAGANSILRKPILINQVSDTLTTARDLLRAKQESAQAAVVTAASTTAAPVPVMPEPATEKMLRAGEFLHSAGPTPGTLFDTEPDLHDEGSEPVDALKELEPTAASVTETAPAPLPPTSDEPRGLAWYLNARGVTRPAAPSPTPSAPAPRPDKPELLGFDQTPSFSASAAPATHKTSGLSDQHLESEKKNEAALFAYMSGEGEAENQAPKPSFRLGKRAILGALVLASVAIAAAPQAPWHGDAKLLWARGLKMTHAWLNPQPVTTTPAPRSHEDFARAGDEYKLPVAENIPDATTDPSQIRVTPVVDPTANKKLNNGAGNPDQNSPDPAATNTPDPSPPAIQVQENQPAQPAPTNVTPAAPPSSTDRNTTSVPSPPQPQTHNDPPIAAPLPAPSRSPQLHSVSAASTTAIPSSLQSQMASTVPDAGGNKPVEAAMPAIEPVAVPESTERGLLAEQPPIAYPANTKVQGTVVLQVLIGRDGTVQDAKFVQGSLAFARAAIDGVKLWKFKPYLMNGRPVSVQTQMSMTFKAGSVQ